MTTPTPEITAEDWDKQARADMRVILRILRTSSMSPTSTQFMLGQEYALRELRLSVKRRVAARREKEQEDGK